MILWGLLSDGSDNLLSSKRVVTLLSFILCGVAFMANVFFGYDVDANLFDSMIYLTMAGLGFTASEKFLPINKKNKTSESPND